MLNQKLIKYMEENFYDEIYDSINEIIGESNTIEDFEITNSEIYDRFELDFWGQLKVNVYIKNVEFSNSNQRPWFFIVRFNGTMETNSMKCWGFVANRDDELFKKRDNYMYNSFLPLIKEDEYEEIAEIFLDKYFPEYKKRSSFRY